MAKLEQGKSLRIEPCSRSFLFYRRHGFLFRHRWLLRHELVKRLLHWNSFLLRHCSVSFQAWLVNEGISRVPMLQLESESFEGRYRLVSFLAGRGGRFCWGFDYAAVPPPACRPRAKSFPLHCVGGSERSLHARCCVHWLKEQPLAQPSRFVCLSPEPAVRNGWYERL